MCIRNALFVVSAFLSVEAEIAKEKQKPQTPNVIAVDEKTVQMSFLNWYEFIAFLDEQLNWAMKRELRAENWELNRKKWRKFLLGARILIYITDGHNEMEKFLMAFSRPVKFLMRNTFHKLIN